MEARLSRGEWVSLSLALLWSVALLVAAPVAPAYRWEEETSAGTVARGTATFVEVNGPGILLIVGVPLLVTVIVGGALLRRRARGGAGPIAWTFTGVLAGFNLVAMASIGWWITPVTACLATACAIRHARSRGGAGSAVVPM